MNCVTEGSKINTKGNEAPIRLLDIQPQYSARQTKKEDVVRRFRRILAVLVIAMLGALVTPTAAFSAPGDDSLLPTLIEVVPVAASFTQPTCEDPTGASVTIPTTTGIDYLINGGVVISGISYPLSAGHTHVMTAVAQEGYVINGEFSQSITIIDVPECTLIEVVPVEAEFTQPTCEDPEGGSVTIPTTVGIDYLVNGGPAVSGLTYPLNPGGTNVMTAVAQEGYVINGEFSQSITINAVPECPTTTPTVTSTPTSTPTVTSTPTSTPTVTSTPTSTPTTTPTVTSTPTTTPTVTSTPTASTAPTKSTTSKPAPTKKPSSDSDAGTGSTVGLPKAGAEGPSALAPQVLALFGVGVGAALVTFRFRRLI